MESVNPKSAPTAGADTSTLDVAEFRKELLGWWKTNSRSYPWRNTRDPYKILVAEVLLHRTRADQVSPVYRAFLSRFPDLNVLAVATADEVHAVLRPLGLRWRVDLMIRMAEELISRYDGLVPEATEELLALPGVGPYISGAVRSFAFEKSEPILDTNTVRIAARLFCIAANDSSRRSARFRSILGTLVDPHNPREFNLALIDHGALVCTSRNPRCGICPVSHRCCYGTRIAAQGLVSLGST